MQFFINIPAEYRPVVSCGQLNKMFSGIPDGVWVFSAEYKHENIASCINNYILYIFAKKNLIKYILIFIFNLGKSWRNGQNLKKKTT